MRQLRGWTEGRGANVVGVGRHGWRSFLVRITHGASYSVLAAGRAVSAEGVFTRATLAMHFGVVHFKVNRLKIG